jgi:multiple sugar transport system ATP-binding protein
VLAAVEATAEDEGQLFADDRASFTAAIDSKRPVRTGEPVELAVDHRSLHFFDPETGLALDSGARTPAAA